MMHKDINHSKHIPSFVDCNESFNLEEIKEVKSVDDSLTIHQEIENSNVSQERDK